MMDTATLVMITLLASVFAMMAWFWLEQYFHYRKRTKHSH